ncbi:MAG: sigma-70 family RNA polymerase sigma factor [Bacteroides thetaiotaomicron]
MKRANDMDARFEQFYAANFPRVKNFARLLTKSEEDAEDMAQNIFLKLWTRPDLWQGQESMTGYLYTVTRNEIFNLFKHQKVEQEYESHIIRSQLIGELCDDTPPFSKIFTIKRSCCLSNWHLISCLPAGNRFLR